MCMLLLTFMLREEKKTKHVPFHFLHNMSIHSPPRKIATLKTQNISSFFTYVKSKFAYLALY